MIKGAGHTPLSNAVKKQLCCLGYKNEGVHESSRSLGCSRTQDIKHYCKSEERQDGIGSHLPRHYIPEDLMLTLAEK